MLIEKGFAQIVPLGTAIGNVFGSIRMTRDTILVDSLVGTMGGPVRLVGGLGVKSLL